MWRVGSSRVASRAAITSSAVSTSSAEAWWPSTPSRAPGAQRSSLPVAGGASSGRVISLSGRPSGPRRRRRGSHAGWGARWPRDGVPLGLALVVPDDAEEGGDPVFHRCGDNGGKALLFTATAGKRQSWRVRSTTQSTGFRSDGGCGPRGGCVAARPPAPPGSAPAGVRRCRPGAGRRRRASGPGRRWCRRGPRGGGRTGR